MPGRRFSSMLRSMAEENFRHLRGSGWISPEFAVLGFLYQCGDAFAFLVLAACGLAVIFGMMGVINLAHGEFIMCGAYVTVATARAGLPLPLAILSGALAAALVGLVVERLGDPSPV